MPCLDLGASFLLQRHNDLAYQIRVHFQNQFSEFDLFENGSAFPPEKVGYSWQTDIPRLKAGKVGAQVDLNKKINHLSFSLSLFLSVSLSCSFGLHSSTVLAVATMPLGYSSIRSMSSNYSSKSIQTYSNLPPAPVTSQQL